MASLSFYDGIKLSEESVIGKSSARIIKNIILRKGGLIEEFITLWEKKLQPQLSELKQLSLVSIDWDKVYESIRRMNLRKHVLEACKILQHNMVSSMFTGIIQSMPSLSYERIHVIDLGFAKVDLLAGVMLPPYVPEHGLLYGAYIVYGFGGKVNYNLKDFERVEKVLPNAAYKALVPPGPPGSEKSETFFGEPLRCTSSLDAFKESIRKYVIFDRGFRNPYAYSVQVKINGVLLDLELWLRWKPKRILIWKHMKQGKSLPPSKVIEILERREELEVVALRIPAWLKEKLRKEAEARGEQLGTYLRKILESLYS